MNASVRAPGATAEAPGVYGSTRIPKRVGTVRPAIAAVQKKLILHPRVYLASLYAAQKDYPDDLPPPCLYLPIVSAHLAPKHFVLVRGYSFVSNANNTHQSLEDHLESGARAQFDRLV